MVFGDSTVVGRAVPQDQTIHAHLQRILKHQGLNVEVINAGVEGYSTDQELLRMEELLPLYKPDIVLLAVCSNDFAANELGVSSGLNKPRFQLASNGSLTEIQPQSNHDLLTFRSWPNQWLHYSAAYRFLSPRVRVLRAKFGSWQEQNLLGLPLDLYYQPATDRIDWKLFRALLVRIRESCLRAGALFLLYAHPALEEVWDPSVRTLISVLGVKPEQYDRYALEKRLHTVALEAGIDHCLLIEHFEKRQNRGPFHLLPREGHCNPAGYELTAEVLAAHMARHSYFPEQVVDSCPSESAQPQPER
jgi:lysophospholipase L1-like esterase